MNEQTTPRSKRVRTFLRGAFAWAVVGLLVTGLPVMAQDLEEDLKRAQAKKPDPVAGVGVARKLCASCHLIGEEGGVASADVPTFTSIANRPDQSEQNLKNWLVLPHAPMPDPHLSEKEIRDLAAYILSLRTAQ